MEKIKSFTVDHRILGKGFYVSRRDGNVTTYDLRTRAPYKDEIADNSTLHTVEHMFATFIRNSRIGTNVLYFGPMGCQTGYYLLVKDESDEKVYEAAVNALERITAYRGEVFGNSEKECGNCRNLDLEKARAECAAYLAVLKNKKTAGADDYADGN